MKIARSNAGGALASFGIRRCLWLMPVKTEACSKGYVMLRHPQPIAKLHCIIVPRKRFQDIGVLLQNEVEWLGFSAFVESQVCFREVSLCCNYGCRQEVKQVHVHVISKEKLAQKGDEELTLIKLGGQEAKFGSKGNVYMDAAGLPHMEYVRETFAEANRRYAKGFSIGKSFLP